MTLPLMETTIGVSNRQSDGVRVAVRWQLFFEHSDVAASISVPCGECISTLSGGVVVTGAICDSMTRVERVVSARTDDTVIVIRRFGPEVSQSSWEATSVIIIHCVVDCACIDYPNGE